MITSNFHGRGNNNANSSSSRRRRLLFFRRQEFCVQVEGGTFQTINPFRVFAFLYRNDLPGKCDAKNCQELCNHKPCVPDYEVLENGGQCKCKSKQSFTCNGPNTECRRDQCECLPGFRQSGGTEITVDGCNDIDECIESNNGVCQIIGATGECINTVPAFQCPCRAGFTQENPPPGSNAAKCIDFDECAAGFCVDPNNNAVCTNTEGSYTCACRPGYFGTAPTQCFDINECETGAFACGPNQRWYVTYKLFVVIVLSLSLYEFLFDVNSIETNPLLIFLCVVIDRSLICLAPIHLARMNVCA